MSELRRQLAAVAIPHMRETLDSKTLATVAQVNLEPTPKPKRVVR
jgi:hypothetical protein